MCDHLTNFAVLVDHVPDVMFQSSHRAYHHTASYIGCGLAIVFLVIALFFPCIFKVLKVNNFVFVLIFRQRFSIWLEIIEMQIFPFSLLFPQDGANDHLQEFMFVLTIG
jgi:hypothetical protein